MSERLTLHALQDEEAKKQGYSDFDHLVEIANENPNDVDDQVTYQEVKYMALEEFHYQEIQFLQQQLDKANKWVSVDIQPEKNSNWIAYEPNYGHPIRAIYMKYNNQWMDWHSHDQIYPTHYLTNLPHPPTN